MFRYPGGKNKIGDIIQLYLYDLKIIEYREPFFGGGSIGLSYIDKCSGFFGNLKRVWLNDFDINLFYLWESVKNDHENLKTKIMEYRPKVEDFYEFRNDLLNDRGDAFKKLVIHQISYSGLGTKSGGPLGGKKQKSKYKIDCRWSAEYICKEIDMSHRLLNKFETKLSSQDFSVLLQDTDSSMLIYLDPPYYVKGNELYSVQFSEDDHERLADMLKEVKCKWVLSYDKNDRVLELYKWARIEEIFVNYTITGSNIKKEVIITNG